MDLIILISIIVWIVSSAIVASFGNERKIGAGGALLASLFLSPILAMLFVLASEKKIRKPVSPSKSTINSNQQKILIFILSGIALILVLLIKYNIIS